MTGVPPGLQNQCGALGASRVGSIPTCPRQRKLSEYYEKGFSNTSIYNMIQVSGGHAFHVRMKKYDLLTEKIL